MGGREAAGYIVSPTIESDEAVIFVPGLGGRTKFVDQWNVPGEPVIHRATWSQPLNVPPIDERGGALASLIARAGASDVVLVGHSMGGLVCLEAAKHLGQRLRGIVIMCQYPPHRTPLSALAELPDRALAAELDVPPHIRDTAALPEYARLWRSEYQLLNRYLESDPRPVLNAPMIVVGATDDESSHDTECLNDWSHYTTKSSSVHMTDGGHQMVEQLSPETLHEWVRQASGHLC